MTRQQPERAEQAEIVKLLRMLGASVYVLGTTRKRGDYQGTCMTPGIPDLYVLWPSADETQCFERGMWIEVKSATGRLSAAQRRFQAECHGAGIQHLVGGLDAVIAWCQQNGKLRTQP